MPDFPPIPMASKSTATRIVSFQGCCINKVDINNSIGTFNVLGTQKHGGAMLNSNCISIWEIKSNNLEDEINKSKLLELLTKKWLKKRNTD